MKVKKSLRKLGAWLVWRKRRKYKYDRVFNYFIKHLIIFALCFVVFMYGLKQLSEYFLIPLAILGFSGYFAIKSFAEICKECNNWHSRQVNIVKIIAIVGFIVLLFFIFQSRAVIYEKVKKVYDEEIPVLKIDLGEVTDTSTPLSQGNSPSQEKTENANTYKRDVGVIEQEIIRLVNEERQSKGIRALSQKQNLNSFARSWSDKMISENFFEHSSLNFNFPSTAGENIGETPIHYSVIGCGATYRNDKIAECFVSGWIGSPGHYKNMMNSGFSMTGVGVSCSSSLCRATQVFAG